MARSSRRGVCLATLASVLLCERTLAFQTFRAGTTRLPMKAVSQMPPPTTTAVKEPQFSDIWTPDSWRSKTPRQMPLYDDQVSETAGRFAPSRMSCLYEDMGCGSCVEERGGVRAAGLRFEEGGR